ncbi:hypothetical protein CapIbe_004004 [Capra ibex]
MRTSVSPPLSLEEPLVQHAPASPGSWGYERRTCAKPTPSALRSANQPQARDSSLPVLLNPDCAKLRNRLELREECPRFCCHSAKGRAGER